MILELVQGLLYKSVALSISAWFVLPSKKLCLTYAAINNGGLQTAILQ